MMMFNRLSDSQRLYTRQQSPVRIVQLVNLYGL
jgi:hypothetical protein